MPDETLTEIERPPALPSELRIALAMSGAIALVLYEAGVTHELYRFVKAWEAFKDIQKTQAIDYAQAMPPSKQEQHEAEMRGQKLEETFDKQLLLETSPEGYIKAFMKVPMEPVVDILTGASAGGINSVFLGACLATETDFAEFHELWMKKPGVEELRYKKGKQPKSLFDSQHLRDAISHLLTKSMANKKEPPQGLDLRVRLCRTDIAGTCRTSQDALGHVIEMETRSNIIEFNERDFIAGKKEELLSDKVDKLTEAALATSAFPIAFPPVRWPKKGKGQRWYTDGGLWNNQPIDLAVEAIKDKPAYKKTNRCILFVEPNPTQKPKEPETDQTPSEPSAAEVALIIPTIGLKGDIWPALQQILNYNQRKFIYDGLVVDPVVQNLTSSLGTSQRLQSEDQLADPSSARLEQFTALNRIRMHSLFFDDEPGLIERFVRIGKSLDSLARRNETTAPNLGSSILNALNVVGDFDLERRSVRTQIESMNTVLNSVVEARPEEKPPDNEVRVLVAKSEAYKRTLYEHLADLNAYLLVDVDPASGLSKLKRSRFALTTEDLLDELESGLQAQRAREKGETGEGTLSVAELFAAIETGAQEWLAWIAYEADQAPEPKRWGEAETGTGAGLAEQSTPLTRSQGDDQSLQAAMSRVADAAPSITDADYGQHVLAAVSDLIGKQRLDLIRISPNDTDNLHLITDREDKEKSNAARKLAGEGLGHLTGFLERRWRRNDYVWGRLDACEVLLQTLRKYGQRDGTEMSEELYKEILTTCQSVILKHEAALHNAEEPRLVPIDITKVGATGIV